ncbi:MAG: hypothetical protein ABIA02_03910 [Candidatus Falkowbacteria bacterium]
MNKQNFHNLEKDLEKKYKKRDKKKNVKMKVSGGKIKDLQRIIKNKA